MAGIIDRLTEGVVNRDMRAEGHALLTKWEKTGLLEGLNSERKRKSMARLLENQAKELLRESSSMSAGDVEGFAAVAFPIVRRVFAGLIANDLVSVQPMSLPSGLIFFLDFVFSPNLGETTTIGRFGNEANKSIYGTDQVGAQITGGVDLINTDGSDQSGPRTAGGRGYSYSSPSGSTSAAKHANTAVFKDFWTIGDETATQSKYVVWDPDLLALSGTHQVCVVDVAHSTYADADADFNNLSAFSASAPTTAAGAGCVQVRRLTQIVPENGSLSVPASALTSEAQAIRLVYTRVSASLALSDVVGATVLNHPIVDNFDAGSSMGSVVGATVWGLEANTEIPEIDIKVDSIAVTAQTKKLKAKWTPELGQDLNAYHNLDAEVELTSILSEQIALEIDREILADLVNGATAGTNYWSRSPGMFLNRETGVEIGASAKAPDFTGTVSEWYETLAETINDVSAQIHRKTLRGGANFIVCGPEVANILEFTAGFRASVTHDDESGSVGAVKVGSLSKKWDVIVDPYFLRNVILVGRRGSSFLESGYVYAPYVPLQTTPTIFGPEDFVPRKGVMTRYAKQMVRPDLYGLVVVQGLLGISGG
jgi:hypothetical protein|tara:strand:- start:448 stop:2232 length:1785 start_codon:yes stop_codon:yes gene_type:complete